MGNSFERYVLKNGKKLRCGYTTGSCAAAAAGAAADFLLTGNVPLSWKLLTPSGASLELEIVSPRCDGVCASCFVKKDAGDDPDVTDGILVGCRVWKSETADFSVEGGEGVGRVTKPGLKCPVGAAAINPVPREMILGELRRSAERCQYSGGMRAEIIVPRGKELAGRTYNPRLGIEGGISILGTSGIVEPMSEQALLDTIEMELRAVRASGRQYAVITPGNYGVDFCSQQLCLDPEQAIKCSNDIGETLDLLSALNFSGVLLVGHAGKLVKLAAGIMNTHSRVADGRMEVLTAHAALCGGSQKLAADLMGCNVTDTAFELLKAQGMLDAVMKSIMDKIESRLALRIPDLHSGAILFSDCGVWRTSHAGELLKKCREEAG